MSDKIRISGIMAEGVHGLLEQEKMTPQPFIVDIELELDLEKAATKDDLSETVNYDEVAKLVVEAIKGPSLNLIEALADRVATRVLHSSDLIDEVKVTVHKPKAPISVPFGDVSVTLKKAR
jgi:dihydroneopterin aldolase/2-amino-4-hydroxy-6-hydroxymethyldihydropteridine diphosphokinase